MSADNPTRLEVWNHRKGVCYLCNRKVAAGELWEAEHRKPKGLGGSNHIDNQFVAHVDCHKPKTKVDVKIMRKADRQGKKAAGITRPKRKLQSRGFGEWKPNVKQLVEGWE